MAKKIQLSIPEPCHENWDAMTQSEKGRFCGSCQKQVIDFSTMSDRQIAEFFKKPTMGSVCGRFMTDQLEREIDIPKKRIPWFKYFFQFALPAFLLSIKGSSAKAQGDVKVNRAAVDTTKPTIIRLGMVARPTCTKPVIDDTTIISPITNNRTISGIITNEVGDPVPGATILIKGKKLETISDNNGQFRVLAKTGDVLVAASAGHENTEITVGTSNKVTLTIRRSDKIGTEVVVVMAGGISVSYDPPKKIKQKKEIVEEIITGKVMTEKGDPVPGASVTIKGTKTGVPANANGEFSIKAKKKDVLRFSSAGLEVKDVAIEDQKNISVYLKTIWVGEVAVVKTKKSKELEKISLIQEIKNTEATFKIFPNPVEAGTSLNIELQKTEEGYHTIELLNQSGQSVHQQEVWIAAGTKQLSITIPETTAGNYFIMMTNKKTGKKSTEKIIIQ